MKQSYQKAMEWLYLACIVLSGTALVAITLIIPLGVFMRYAMNNPLSWPEPASVVMMVMFSFIGGAAVYRANAQIAVEALLEAVMLKISDGTDDFALLAIPFFVLAGAIMAEGGMAARLVNLARVFVGFIRGGMAIVNILASTLFGCISGSSVADTASIGSVMIPQMIKQGYPRVFATNVTICGSVQALMIPPSHNAVIYSVAAGGTISVASLFLAGILPGLLFGACLIGLLVWTAHRRI